MPGVQVPPYFSQDLFSLIRSAKTQTPLNIITMSEKDWTRLLTEEHITMEINPVTGLSQYRPCKPELASPTTDWETVWSHCRLNGVPPDLASFLWKLLLNLLCTQEKLHKIHSVPSPLCKLCSQATPGTLEHTFIDCDFHSGVGSRLLNCCTELLPNLTANSLLQLEFSSLEEDMKLPSILLTAITFSFIWSHRMSNTKFRAYQVRAELEQTINLLRTTRHSAAADKLLSLSNQMFH